MTFLEDLSWIYSDLSSLIITILSTFAIYVGVILVTRLNGLRTFAKMSSFDFAITIAIGSLIASTMLSKSQSIANGLVGLFFLIGLQALVAALRKRSDLFEKAVTNTPVLLMSGSEILYEKLNEQKVTESDLIAKLREANVTHFDQVLAVVLETTGDMSVLHKATGGDELHHDLLKYVDPL